MFHVDTGERSERVELIPTIVIPAHTLNQRQDRCGNKSTSSGAAYEIERPESRSCCKSAAICRFPPDSTISPQGVERSECCRSSSP